MNNKEFAEQAIKIAKNYRTNYFWGAFGWPTTNSNIKRLLNQYPENYSYLSKADGSQFSFDCSGLCKAIIWGWNGSDDVYGGAKYGINGLNDVNDEGLKAMCSDVSSNFSNIQVGELLFTSGHVGIAIGNGMAVEATPSWNGGVQISAIGNIGAISGLPTRNWQCHGKFRLIDYSPTVNANVSAPSYTQTSGVAYAQYFDESLFGTYKVSTGGYGLNLRKNCSQSADIIKAFQDETQAICYGYYSIDNATGVKWYLVVIGGYKGFMSSEYLIKN